ncbi:copper resistance protein CopC [Nonomuraea sp. NPDC003804]|uniref:copper resistance CopC family protein n=1 Tax=Nonomuraea sp. NPDC003804 TaxID=3154547 RepID=UPI0033B5436A
MSKGSVRRGLVLVAACWLLVVLGATPALAHDRLKSSSPARNATVASVEEIELEFTSSVRLPAIVLHDGDGSAVTLRKPKVDGKIVTVAVPEPLPAGRYVIGWRVVSTDGHPIEGEIPFSVKGGPSATPTPTASAAPSSSGDPATAASAEATPAVSGEATPGSSAEAAPDSSAVPAPAVTGSSPGAPDAVAATPAANPAADGVPVWLWATAGVLAVAGGALLLLRRRREEPGEEG